MSKRQFEALDLLFFSLIGAALDVAIAWGFGHFSVLYSVSFAVVLALIAMVRWGYPGVVVALISGGARVLYDSLTGSSVSLNWILANTAGYLAVLIDLLYFLKPGKKAVVSNPGFSILYVVSGFLLTALGKTLCYIGSADFLVYLQLFLLYDLLNMLIGVGVFFLARKQSDLVTDMNEYLVKIHTQSPEAVLREKIRSEKDEYSALEEMADKDEVSDIALLDGGMVTNEELAEQEAVRKKLEGNSSSVYQKEREQGVQYKDKKKSGRKF